MAKRLLHGIAKAYRRLPEPVRYCFRPLNCTEEVASYLPDRPRVLTQHFVEHCRHMLAALRHRGTLVRLTGPCAAGDGRELAVVTDLSGDNYAYWTSVLFRRAPSRTVLKPVRGTEALRTCTPATADAALVLLKHHRPARSLARRMGFLSIPTWVESFIDTRRSLEDIVTGGRSGRKFRKNEVRKVARDGFEARLARDPEDVGVFLRDWQGALRERFGAQYSGHSIDWMRQVRRFCEVLWIERGGERCGGVLLEPRLNALRMVGLGMRDAARAREGLLAACYYFSIDQAATRGCSELDLGGTRPVLSDGVLGHKRAWGAHLRTAHQWEYVALRADPTDPAVRALFAVHPVVAEIGGRLHAVVDRAAMQEPIVPSMRTMLAHGGLSGTMHLDRCGTAFVEAPAGRWLSPESGSIPEPIHVES